eukprot:5056492-Prymnesium_polylepis.1
MHALLAARRAIRPFATASRSRSLLASIDQGTSSSRVILYDESLTPVASHQARREATSNNEGNKPVAHQTTAIGPHRLPSATTNPKPGWSQMDPMAILSTVNASAAGALEKAGATASDVVGIGVTNQRESTVVWDRATGAPLYDCVLWHDARTAGTSAMLEGTLGGKDVRFF